MTFLSKIFCSLPLLNAFIFSNGQDVFESLTKLQGSLIHLEQTLKSMTPAEPIQVQRGMTAEEILQVLTPEQIRQVLELLAPQQPGVTIPAEEQLSAVEKQHIKEEYKKSLEEKFFIAVQTKTETKILPMTNKEKFDFLSREISGTLMPRLRTLEQRINDYRNQITAGKNVKENIENLKKDQKEYSIFEVKIELAKEMIREFTPKFMQAP